MIVRTTQIPATSQWRRMTRRARRSSIAGDCHAAPRDGKGGADGGWVAAPRSG